jgi:hypothetical protein
MEVNYIAILGAAVAAMVVGFVYYGPLFGKRWMKIIGATDAHAMSPEAKKEMMVTTILQFIIVLGEIYILAHFVQAWPQASGVETAIWLWLGFVVPTVAASVMWTLHSTKTKLEIFALQAGHHLITLALAGYILQTWS